MTKGRDTADRARDPLGAGLIDGILALRGGDAALAEQKIADIFAGCDIDSSAPTRSNAEGILETIRLLEEVDEGLIFTNLVETDSMFGHRNDPEGFHGCLREFDRELPRIRAAMREDGSGMMRNISSSNTGLPGRKYFSFFL